MHRLPKNHLEVIESAFDNSLVKGAKRTFNCGELARAYRIALDKLLQAQGQESAGDEEGSEGKQVRCWQSTAPPNLSSSS